MKIFLLLYLDKDGKHRESFMFYPLNSYVAQANRNQNPEFGTNMLVFPLDLSASDKRDFGFVSKNI